jgi:hypothetical protein
MTDAEGMRSGVAEGGRVTAADVTAAQTQSQMHPRRAQLEAFLTALCRLRDDRTDQAEMGIEIDGSGTRRGDARPR